MSPTGKHLSVAACRAIVGFALAITLLGVANHFLLEQGFLAPYTKQVMVFCFVVLAVVLHVVGPMIVDVSAKER